MINFQQRIFLSLEGYDTEVRKSRRKTGKSTNEFFTPYSIVKKMADKISEEDWQDPTKTFLEPCAGNFQFICYIIWNRIQHEVNLKTALETCYCVELMQDNIDEGRARTHELLRSILPEYDPEIADEIMTKNFVVHDFFTWNFNEWREMTEDEMKKYRMKK